MSIQLKHTSNNTEKEIKSMQDAVDSIARKLSASEVRNLQKIINYQYNNGFNSHQDTHNPFF